MKPAPATFAYTRISQLERALERARPFVAAYGQTRPVGARLLAGEEARAIDAALSDRKAQS